MKEAPLWIGTSWKMNGTLAEARAYARELWAGAMAIDKRFQPFVVPPFTSVADVKEALSDTRVKVGAQNMHWADKGAWTGEISPEMLTACGLDLVELGHSERREHFGETDETVGLKVEAAIRHGLTPLICIGETLTERDAGNAADVLERQVRGALGKLSSGQMSAPIVFAYEPVWAIGDGGIPAAPDYADERQGEIADLTAEIVGRKLPCLYGGSVNLGNCADLIVLPNVDGLFIGRSAWTARGYLDILARCAAALSGGKDETGNCR